MDKLDPEPIFLERHYGSPSATLLAHMKDTDL